MKKVVFPFHSQATLVCNEAKQMLKDAGFEVVCNESGKRVTPEELKEYIKDAYAVVAGTEKYTEEILNCADNLKTVIRFGVGTDNFDLTAMKNMGIQVGRIANHNAVAEFALTLILSLIKNIPLYDNATRKGQWARFESRELSYKTVGLIGFGRIGKRLAELLKGFETKVLVYDPYINPKDVEPYNVIAVSLDELLGNSDIVSLHLPATEATKHIINEETIAKMKDGAYLINTARGALVNEAALRDALERGKLKGAALDVFEKEPVTEDNPLFALDNTVLAPHVAALTYETNYNAGIICAQSVINVLNGKEPVYPI